MSCWRKGEGAEWGKGPRSLSPALPPRAAPPRASGLPPPPPIRPRASAVPTVRGPGVAGLTHSSSLLRATVSASDGFLMACLFPGFPARVAAQRPHVPH